MKKAILTLLCCAMLGGAVSCNKSDDIVSQSINDSITKTGDIQKIESNVTSNESRSKEEDDHFNVSVQTVHGSYSGGSTYINKQNDLFITKTDDQRYFFIPRWGKCFSVMDDFSNAYDAVCGSVGEETAWIFEYEYEQTGNTNGKSTIFTMLKIHRESGVQERSTISVPIYLYGNFSGMFCNMLDENTGFVFIYGLEDSKTHLVSLLKTTDGGVNWTTIERDTSWPSQHWRDSIIVSHFFDENNGMIVPRTSAGANANAVYITLDGGKTWDGAKIPYSDYDPELIGADDRYLELSNFEYVNGEYILTFRLNGDGIEREELIFFASADLKTWVYLS